MKLPVSSLCRGLFGTALALLSLTTVVAAQSFEGRIHMEITGAKKKDALPMDFSMKGQKVRIDMVGQNTGKHGGGLGGMIYDVGAQEIFILMDMDGQKTYMRRSMAKDIEKATQKGQMGAVPVATGRTEVIAGYPTAEYRSTSENGDVTEMWLAKGLGTFMSMNGQSPMGRGAPSPEWEKFAREGNFFPMRVVSLNKKGKEETRMEVTKVEKTSLPDSLFSVDGYNEFKMPVFGGAFNPFKH
jgi:hypothetical protein